MKRGLALIVTLLLASCNSAPGVGPGGSRSDAGSTPDRSDGGGSCTSVSEGCLCGTAPPRDCYLDPTSSATGGMECHVGTRYCRDGLWSACEGVRSYTLETTSTALLTGPTTCNPCDPLCYAFSDTPTTSDLTPGNSMNVSYDPLAGGIRPTSATMMCTTTTTPAATGNYQITVGPVVSAAVTCGTCTPSAGGVAFSWPSSPPSVTTTTQAERRGAPFDGGPSYDFGDIWNTTVSRTGSTSSAADDVNFGCGSAGRDAGFRFTLSQAQNTTISLRYSSYDTVLGLYNVSTGAFIGCNDDSWGLQSEMTVSLAAGTYAVVVDGYSGATGNYQLTIGPVVTAAVTCPPCTPSAGGVAFTVPGTATAVTTTTQAERRGAPFDGGPSYDFGSIWNTTVSARGTTVGALDDVNTGVSIGAPDAGFRFTLAQAQNTTISTAGSAFNTVLGIWDTSSGTLIATNDDGPGIGLQSSITTMLSAGTYAVIVDGYPAVTTTSPGCTALPPLAACTFTNPDGTCYSGTVFYHSLPMGGPAVIDPLPINVQIRSADVYFLMDTTGSMGGELSNLQASLTSGTFIAGCSGGIMGAIRCTMPNAWFGAGFHDDYPYGSVGTGGCDVVFGHRQDMTSNMAAVQTAINGLGIHCGNDGPESQIPAIYSIASGLGLPGYVGARTGCPAGTFGYPCFRTGSVPIIVYITDAPFHNGPSGAYTYPGALSAPTFAQAVAALNANGVRVIEIQTCGSWGNSYCLEGEDHGEALANATGSLSSTGSPYVFRANADGTGVSTAIVNAITNLANYTTMNITARAVGDTRGFTQSITALSWGPGTCSGISGGNTFLACLPGTAVNFNVTFNNTAVAATAVPQTFDFWIEVVGNGTIILSRIPVRIVVPPASTTFAPTATYWHDYCSGPDTPPTAACATARCAINERPVWGTVTWNTAIPAGTSIRLDLRSADLPASVPTATPYATLPLTNGTGTADAGALLLAAGVPNNLRYLRAFVTMNSSMDLLSAPTLTSLNVTYTCVPAE